MSHAIDLVWTPPEGPGAASGHAMDHAVRFSGGLGVAMSSAPAYGGNPALVNPEEALAAALSSCHLMTFLALSSKAGWQLSGYRDHAVAALGRMENGRMRIDRITLHPVVTFAQGQERPLADLAVMHERAHRYCFVANTLDCEMDIVLPTEGDAA